MNWLTLAGALAALVRALAALLTTLRLDRKAKDDARNAGKSRSFDRLVKALRARNRARERMREAATPTEPDGTVQPETGSKGSAVSTSNGKGENEPNDSGAGTVSAAPGMHDDKYRRDD